MKFIDHRLPLVFSFLRRHGAYAAAHRRSHHRRNFLRNRSRSRNHNRSATLFRIFCTFRIFRSLGSSAASLTTTPRRSRFAISMLRKDSLNPNERVVFADNEKYRRFVAGNDHGVGNDVHGRSVHDNIIEYFFKTFEKRIHIFAVKKFGGVRRKRACLYNIKILVFLS